MLGLPPLRQRWRPSPRSDVVELPEDPGRFQRMSLERRGELPQGGEGCGGRCDGPVAQVRKVAMGTDGGVHERFVHSHFRSG